MRQSFAQPPTPSADFDGVNWEPEAVQSFGEAPAPGQTGLDTAPGQSPGAADLLASSQLISSLQSPQTDKQQRVTEATAGLQPVVQQEVRSDEQLALDRRRAFLDAPSSMAGYNNVRKLLAEEADARGGNTAEYGKDFALPLNVKQLEHYLGQQQQPQQQQPASSPTTAGQNGALSAETEANAQAAALAAQLPPPQNFNQAFDQAGGGADTLSQEQYNAFLQGPFAASLRSKPENRNDKPAPDHQAIIRKNPDGPDQNAMAAVAAMGGNTSEMFRPFSAQVHAAQLAQAPKSSILAKLPLLDPQLIQRANQRPNRIQVNGGFV